MAGNTPPMARMASSTQDVDMRSMFNKEKGQKARKIAAIAATASSSKGPRGVKRLDVKGAGVFASRQTGIINYDQDSVYHKRILADKRRQLRPLLNALRFVESSDRLDVPDGDQGTSIGPLQISEDYFKDAWQVKDTTDTWDNVRKLDHAEVTVVQYWMKYCPDAVETLDFERLAKVHNGGPKGAQRESTGYYWSKVMRHLRQQGLSIPENATHLPPRRPSHFELGRMDVKLNKGPKPVAKPLPKPDEARQVSPLPLPPSRRGNKILTAVPTNTHKPLSRHISLSNVKSAKVAKDPSKPKAKGLSRRQSTGSVEVTETVTPKCKKVKSGLRVVSLRARKLKETESSEGFVVVSDASEEKKTRPVEEHFLSPFSLAQSVESLSPRRALYVGYWNNRKWRETHAAIVIQSAWRMYTCKKAYLTHLLHMRSRLPSIRTKPPRPGNTTPRGTPRFFSPPEEEPWLVVGQEDELRRQLTNMLQDQPNSPHLTRFSSGRPPRSGHSSGYSTPLTLDQEEKLLEQLAALLPEGYETMPSTPRNRKLIPLASPGRMTPVQVKGLLQSIAEDHRLGARPGSGWSTPRSRLASGATTPVGGTIPRSRLSSGASTPVMTPAREEALLQELAALMYPSPAPDLSSWEARKPTTPLQKSKSFKPSWATVNRTPETSKRSAETFSTPKTSRSSNENFAPAVCGSPEFRTKSPKTPQDPEILFRSSTQVLAELRKVLSSGCFSELGEDAGFGDLEGAGFEEDEVEMSPKAEQLQSLFRYLDTARGTSLEASQGALLRQQTHPPSRAPPNAPPPLSVRKVSNRRASPSPRRSTGSRSAPAGGGSDKENGHRNRAKQQKVFSPSQHRTQEAASPLARLCELWEEQHVELLERATKYMELRHEVASVGEELRRVASASPGKGPFTLIQEVERARARMDGLEDRAELVKSQKDCIYTNISARMTQAERVNLYTAWGIRRWSVGRLRRLVYKQLWADPARYKQSAELTLQYL